MSWIGILVAIALASGLRTPQQRGVLVMAHGGDSDWNNVVEEVVAPLRKKQPTEIALGMADTATLRAAVERLEAQGVREIAVVRMFISGESFLPETEYILGIRKELPPAAATAHSGLGHNQAKGDSHGSHDHAGHSMSPPEPIQSRATFQVSRPGVAESPLLNDILVERVKSLSKDPAGESVLILAHGPGDDQENRRWLANMEERIRGVREMGPFRQVRCETLREDWPHKREAAQRRIREYVEQGGKDGGRVIVVPFRVAGFGPYAEVLEGLSYVADQRGFCPHPNMTRWLEQSAEACFVGHASP